MKIGVIGNGFVGKATSQLNCESIEVFAYDINPESCVPPGLVLSDMNCCEVVFISVPTPMSKNGSCHLNIVKSVLSDLQSINYSGFIVLRSTVPAGTCDDLGIYFMPEFLTEKNYIQDFINNKDWVFGLLNKDSDELFKNTITQLFNLAYQHKRIAYNQLNFLTNKEAEMVKMFKNCFLATKVSFCNEIAELCRVKGINYENVRKIAANDDRILHSHTNVPGPDGKYGFGGTCFPKDTSSLRYVMNESGVTPYILDAIITRNELVDRPEHDWNSNKGRSVVDDTNILDETDTYKNDFILSTNSVSNNLIVDNYFYSKTFNGMATFKYVYFIPKGGINDVFVQINKVIQYCIRKQRILLLDMLPSGYKINFSDFFNINKLDCHVIYNSLVIKYILESKTHTLYPDILEKDSVNLLNDSKKFMWKKGTTIFSYKNTLLDLPKEHVDSDIIVHVCCGGGKGYSFFNHLSLNDSVKTICKEKLNKINDKYICIYVRNTDRKSNYKLLYEKHKKEIHSYNAIYICTDSNIVLEFFKSKKLNVFCFTTFPETLYHSLHNSHDLDGNIKIQDIVVDIYMAICSEKLLTNSTGGFVNLLRNSREHKKYMLNKLY